jgi:DNA-binding transcriptional MerR regulator
VQEYAAEHVVRLERIKRLQADGHTLLEIGRILIGPAAKSAMEPPTA